jgi:Rad3-related DNA helicase
MVDLSKLRGATQATVPTDPVRIFERAPKPEGVNDLWKSQDAVLRAWDERRSERDVVLKLNTGGGKTLVGLLIAQSKMNEHKVGALYLCANKQLVDQTVAKANAFQLPAIKYDAGPGRPLPAAFENGDAILVATYRALFHGYSKFKVRGRGNPVATSVIICDDAHTAFADVRDAFSVVITKKKSEALYRQVTSRLRPAAEAVHRLGSYDHRVGGQDLGVFEVPYWEWSKVAHDVRDLITKFAEESEYQFQLPLISDQFEKAHVLVRSTDITITPLLPPIDQLPTFNECPHRVFMSATIADDSALIRTFNTSATAVRNPIAPGGLAGVGERMILSPALTPIGPKEELATARLLAKMVSERGMGVVVLSPSESLAKNRWSKVAKVVLQDDVAGAVERLNDRSTGDNGPYVLVNRYDGVDLPKDACRLLVMDGLPRGFNAYDEFRAVALGGSSQIELGLAQRVEQGIGRGTRGAGDYCVVLLLDLAQDWVSRRSNAGLMTPGTRAQINLGLAGC